MSVARNRLQSWLGSGFRLRSELVTERWWRSRASRAEYLCRKANTGNHYVHDERAEDGHRRVFFARERP